ncbi:hypothetical protein CFOL_v3_03355 [Cephalotus follicularis]|uniref:Uncharacterized protein n=1 Tax=Cephalotus follicularis TaxID=3775 RepID=A0A1Q3AW14_CEPFO|nr:hypothetical protein CFOL_v3_03355 [Cephalotus follicularis]
MNSLYLLVVSSSFLHSFSLLLPEATRADKTHYVYDDGALTSFNGIILTLILFGSMVLRKVAKAIDQTVEGLQTQYLINCFCHLSHLSYWFLYSCQNVEVQCSRQWTLYLG